MPIDLQYKDFQISLKTGNLSSLNLSKTFSTITEPHYTRDSKQLFISNNEALDQQTYTHVSNNCTYVNSTDLPDTIVSNVLLDNNLVKTFILNPKNNWAAINTSVLPNQQNFYLVNAKTIPVNQSFNNFVLSSQNINTFLYTTPVTGWVPVDIYSNSQVFSSSVLNITSFNISPILLTGDENKTFLIDNSALSVDSYTVLSILKKKQLGNSQSVFLSSGSGFFGSVIVSGNVSTVTFTESNIATISATYTPILLIKQSNIGININGTITNMGNINPIVVFSNDNIIRSTVGSSTLPSVRTDSVVKPCPAEFFNIVGTASNRIFTTDHNQCPVFKPMILIDTLKSANFVNTILRFSYSGTFDFTLSGQSFINTFVRTGPNNTDFRLISANPSTFMYAVSSPWTGTTTTISSSAGVVFYNTEYGNNTVLLPSVPLPGSEYFFICSNTANSTNICTISSLTYPINYNQFFTLSSLDIIKNDKSWFTVTFVNSGVGWVAENIINGSIPVNYYSNYRCAYGDEVLTDTLSGSMTLVMPPFPTRGNKINILDAQNTWSTAPLYINGNGERIESSTSSFIASSGNNLSLVYVGNPIGWKRFI